MTMTREKFRERGYEFVPDNCGWHCAELGTGTCIIPWGSGFKAYRGNDDVVSPTEALRFARPHVFDDWFDAARACATIWGKFAQVTAAGSPLVYEALNDISHDSGGGAGHDAYEVREIWVPRLNDFEERLGRMTRDERQAMAIGEHQEMLDLSERHGLGHFVAMLNEFFNEE